jgi:hypothetical protein
MHKIYLVTLLAALFAISACETDYRPSSIGSADEIIVVMDSTQWDSETALAIEETFGRGIETLPGGFEPKYDLIFRDFRNNDQLDRIREFKNVIFASTIDEESNVGTFIRAILSEDVEGRIRSGESFAFPIEDRWVRDQWALILSSNSDDELAEKIRNSESSLVGHLENREFERRKNEVFRRGEQVAISDSLWENHGWKVRMQHDYIKIVDSLNVAVYARYLPDNNRRMWAWWQDDVPNADFLDQNWINATRDSLMELYMQGERGNSYVTTEYRRPVETSPIERDDRIIGYETLGTWRMTGNFMGGPFVNFTYYDPATERLFMVEYWQFAPSVNKRRFVRQFQAMGRTFDSDSTWNRNVSDAISEAVPSSFSDE